jgi:hypothetical protein
VLAARPVVTASPAPPRARDGGASPYLSVTTHCTRTGDGARASDALGLAPSPARPADRAEPSPADGFLCPGSTRVAGLPAGITGGPGRVVTRVEPGAAPPADDADFGAGVAPGPDLRAVSDAPASAVDAFCMTSGLRGSGVGVRVGGVTTRPAARAAEPGDAGEAVGDAVTFETTSAPVGRPGGFAATAAVAPAGAWIGGVAAASGDAPGRGGRDETGAADVAGLGAGDSVTVPWGAETGTGDATVRAGGGGSAGDGG